ncbi:hypothetical protein HAALTHF_54430n [Vreelandella aquamarina]|nr:hypothetical protein HAALTHF_54430n [Halomonas axialensis]
MVNEPRVTLQPTDPAEVQVSELVFSVLDSLQDDQTVPFGSAFPSPELFPLSLKYQHDTWLAGAFAPTGGG